MKGKTWLAFLMALSGSLNLYATDVGELLQDPLRTHVRVVLDSDARFPNEISADCLQSPPQQGIDAQKTPLSLHDAVDAALCNNPQVRYAWAAIKVQTGALGEARSAYLPTFNTSFSKLKNTTSYPGTSNPDQSDSGQTRYYSLTWRIYDFGARSANHEAANQLLIAALASQDAAIQKVLGTLIGAYFDALTAQAAYTSRAQAYEIALKTVQATQRRDQWGVASRNDTLQAASALAKAKLALQRAQGDLKKFKSVLLYSMGFSLQSDIELAQDLPAAAFDRVKDLQAWIEQAQAKHPAIIAARAQWASAQAKVKSTQADGWPTLDFNQNFYQNGYPNQGLNAPNTAVHTVGLTLSIPLFEGFARQYKVQGAQAHADQSQAQLEDTQNQTVSDVVKAFAEAESAFDNLQASQELLTSAQAALESSQHRYDKGVADVLELLTNQNALADAQQERVRCLAQWRAARLKLMSSAGVLDAQSLSREP